MGFTLIEVMVVVAIIGILASIAIPNFQKFIVKSKLSEANIKLRQIYDLEILFASKPHIYRSASGQDVECDLPYAFSSLRGHWFNSGNGFSGYQSNRVPQNHKSFFRYFGLHKLAVVDVNGVCTNAPRSYWGSPQELGLTSQKTGALTANGWSRPEGRQYFRYSAYRNSALSIAYGVPVADTLYVHAVADLRPNGTDQTVSWNNPFINTNVTILARGLYYKDGEPKGVPGIYKVLE